jgi:HAE1 family hydrophobic/amphiphilic exporter-1
VICEFDYGSDLTAAANDIRDALSFIEEILPDGASKPQVIKLSTNMMPILFYAVTAGESFDGIDKLLEERVISPLNRN